MNGVRNDRHGGDEQDHLLVSGARLDVAAAQVLHNPSLSAPTLAPSGLAISSRGTGGSSPVRREHRRDMTSHPVAGP